MFKKYKKGIIIAGSTILIFLVLRYIGINSEEIARLNHQNCAKLELGMTPSEVLEIMGKPYMVSIKTDGVLMETIYNYDAYNLESFHIFIDFNTEQKTGHIICGDSGYKGGHAGVNLDSDRSRIDTSFVTLDVSEDRSSKLEVQKFYKNSEMRITYSFSEANELKEVGIEESIYGKPIYSQNTSEEEMKQWLNYDIARGSFTRKNYDVLTLNKLDEKTRQEGYQMKEKLYKELGFTY